MAQSQHRDKSQQLTQNQNNLMSDDPKDGSRNSDRTGAADKGEKLQISPEEKAQRDQKTLDAFGEEKTGVLARE